MCIHIFAYQVVEPLQILLSEHVLVFWSVVGLLCFGRIGSQLSETDASTNAVCDSVTHSEHYGISTKSSFHLHRI